MAINTINWLDWTNTEWKLFFLILFIHLHLKMKLMSKIDKICLKKLWWNLKTSFLGKSEEAGGKVPFEFEWARNNWIFPHTSNEYMGTIEQCMRTSHGRCGCQYATLIKHIVAEIWWLDYQHLCTPVTIDSTFPCKVHCEQIDELSCIDRYVNGQSIGCESICVKYIVRLCILCWLRYGFLAVLHVC